MMSNCAFWSESGELLAVHGAGPASDPVVSFPDWAAGLRLPSGRLVSLSSGFPAPEAPASGWWVLPSAGLRRKKVPRASDPAAPVAVFAPALDGAAGRLFPLAFDHPKFRWRAWPTWVSTCRPETGEGPQGWYAALGRDNASRFLVRLVPHRGRLPGDGWRNMLAWTVKERLGLRLVPLNGLPTPEALAAVPSWDYRAEAGQDDAAAWDLQVLPSRRLLASWAPGTSDPWEATALLRWVRPDPPPELGEASGEPRWADLLGRLPVADARLLVHNVLSTLPGGAASAAVLFYDRRILPPGADGRSLVRYVPQPGLPLGLLSKLFGPRVWHDIDRARRFLPPEDEQAQLRSEALAEVDRRLAEGRLSWSPGALALWEHLYRGPRLRALAAEIREYRSSGRWERLLSGDPRTAESLLRSLDVTDAALCLRDVPDRRWRRFVTARRESELNEELSFCRLWEARGELTPEREADAWRSWDSLLVALPLTDGGSGN